MGDDFFFQTLVKSIRKTYEQWHHPEGALHKGLAKANVDTLIEFHITVLGLHYDKERFVNCKDLYAERVKFLGEVQEIVNILRGI